MCSLTVACVLKHGGEYGPVHVGALAAGVERNLPGRQHRFLCLSDRASDVERIARVESIYLDHREWEGWWSKLEVFRLDGPMLYLDLDTVVVGDLGPLAALAAGLPTDRLAMLADFYTGAPQSGIMAWSGSMARVYADFVRVTAAQFAWVRGRQWPIARTADGSYRGDGEWIRAWAKRANLDVTLIQRQVDGVLSYKVDVVRDGAPGTVPDDARVVCFHGRPRPWDLAPRPEWMTSNGWR